ncbi:MAG TPA: hypothetical protein VGC95_07935, partial [Chitinophagaceae bacterium]
MKDFSYITSASPAFIENLYQDYVKDPATVDPEFRKFFEGFDFAVSSVRGTNGNGAAHIETAPAPQKSTASQAATPSQPAAASRAATTSSAASGIDWMSEIQVYRLILGYRNKAHLIANTNPIRQRKDRGANLDLSFFGFSENDLDREFNAGNLVGLGRTALRNIVSFLTKCYASHVGIEFKYISDQKKIDFLTRSMEKEFVNVLSLA